MIPEQLKDWHFVLIRRGEKAPFEKAWQKTANYEWEDPKLQGHVKAGGNYGVLGNGKHFIIDVDSQKDPAKLAEARKVLEKTKTLPNTFVVRTGGGGLHFYYTGEISKAIRLLSPKDPDTNLGDIQGPGKQAVGPGSLHPNGKTYEVARDKPVAEIQDAETKIRELFADYIKPGKPEKSPKEAIDKIRKEMQKKAQGPEPDISSLIDLGSMTRQGDEYYGAHPVHGSETGHNFWVNPTEGIWTCFRHGTGGGAWQLYAVLKSIINCSDARPGALKGDKFKEALKQAQEEGLVPKKKQSVGETDRHIHQIESMGKGDKGLIARVGKKVAKDLIEDYQILTPEDSEEVWIYHPELGYWKREERTIKERIENDTIIIHGETKSGEPWESTMEVTTHLVNEITGHIKRLTLTDPTHITFNQPTNLLNVENGVVDMDTSELMPHDSKFHFRSCLPHKYDPKATCPVTDKFYEDNVAPEDIGSIWDYYGYCLHPGYQYAKEWLLYGPGGGGKTRTTWHITNFLGEENVSSESPRDLSSSPFSRAELDDKQANIYDDMPYDAIRRTGALKMLVGGAAVSVQRKYGHPFKLKNTAKFLFTCNKIPPLVDESAELAFWRRWVPIAYRKKYTEGEEGTDPLIVDKMSTPEEMSGMLNKAIEALKGIKERGSIRQSKTPLEVQRIWERESDPIGGFVQDRCEMGDYTTPKSVIYKVYRDWTDDLNQTPLDEGKFATYLKRAAPNLGDKRPRLSEQLRAQFKAYGVGTKERPPCWIGIRIRGDRYAVPEKEQPRLDKIEVKNGLEGEEDPSDLVTPDQSKEKATQPKQSLQKAQKKPPKGGGQGGQPPLPVDAGARKSNIKEGETPPDRPDRVDRIPSIVIVEEVLKYFEQKSKAGFDLLAKGDVFKHVRDSVQPEFGVSVNEIKKTFERVWVELKRKGDIYEPKTGLWAMS